MRAEAGAGEGKKGNGRRTFDNVADGARVAEDVEDELGGVLLLVHCRRHRRERALFEGVDAAAAAAAGNGLVEVVEEVEGRANAERDGWILRYGVGR